MLPFKLQEAVGVKSSGYNGGVFNRDTFKKILLLIGKKTYFCGKLQKNETGVGSDFFQRTVPVVNHHF
jgi:hypothetical protein